jgi:membrane-associated protein
MHFGMPPLPDLIRSLGLLGVWAFVFAESSFIFFLPGDSLLFTAGFLSSQGLLNLWLLIIGCFICAVVGNILAYSAGHKLGRRIVGGQENWLFRKKHLVAAQDFYAEHGKKAVVLARFMPAVRTFAPIVAGIGQMEYQTFTLYNVLGGFIWVFGLTLLGFYLGKVIPDVDKYLLPIIGFIIIISLIPSAIHFYQARAKAKAKAK